MADDWTAEDLLAGKPEVDHDEQLRRCQEAMDDPESVTLRVVGRNGQTVEHRIRAHERTRLSIAQGYEQEEPEYGYYSFPHEIWVPRWKRFNWSIEQAFDFRAEDFRVPKR